MSQPTLSPERRSALSQPMHERLSRYSLAASAAGVGMLALAHPAEAKIVYTPANVQIPFCTLYQLDLNHDGIADFNFYHCSTGQNGGFGLLSSTRIKSNLIWGQNNLASALKPGVQIHANQQRFAPNHVEMAFWGCTNYAKTCTSGGDWLNKSNHYLGFKFEILGKTHYGWARMNVKFGHQITGTLTGYAYETVANKAIVAGDTKGQATMHQDRSLGHLSRGVAVLPKWRYVR